MKRKLLFPALVLFFGAVFSPPAMGQYFNFASAYTGYQTTTYHSLIRTIDDTSALVYFYDSRISQGVIARIGLTMSCRKALLPRGCTVNDMRITEDNVYFCGEMNADPVIGHIKLSDFATTNRTVNLFKVDNYYVTSLNRMAAYTIDGKQKVVIVGDLVYTTPTPVIDPCPYYYWYFDSSLNQYIQYFYHYCNTTVIFEVNFNGATYLSDEYVITGDHDHVELISEVIETQNHIAFIGFFANHNTTIFHRCDKNNVVNDFISLYNNHYCFYSHNGGLTNYHGCLMKGDTIAISSLSTYMDSMGIQQFSTNIRVFDIATMVNTQSKRVLHNTKTEPLDIMYMIKDHQLVLLQEVYLPAISSNQYIFLHVDPYTTASYNAKCWYECHWNKPFNCISRLNDTIYVASGGEYWCMKDFDPLTSISCYKTDAIRVNPISIVGNALEYDGYQNEINLVSPHSIYVSSNNDFIYPSCVNNL